MNARQKLYVNGAVQGEGVDCKDAGNSVNKIGVFGPFG